MHYIKNLRVKRRAWDKGDVWDTSPQTRATIESLPSFKAVQAQMNQQAQEGIARMRAEAEDHKERIRSKSKDDRARDAVDRVAKTIKEHGELGMNDAKSFDAAKQKAAKIAERAEREGK